MLKFKFDTLEEMAYPANFNMDDFKSINSFAGRVKYANERLDKIASGSARTIFKIDNEKVLKVAKNKKGYAQNRVETDFYFQNFDIIAKVFDYDQENDTYLEMELAKKVSPSRFKKLTGVSLENVWDFLYNLKVTYNLKGKNRNDQLKPLNVDEDNPFLEELREVVLMYDMVVPGDFGRPSTYGEVIRNGQPQIVIVDFGLTNGVYDDFYKKV